MDKYDCPYYAMDRLNDYMKYNNVTLSQFCQEVRDKRINGCLQPRHIQEISKRMATTRAYNERNPGKFKRTRVDKHIVKHIHQGITASTTS